MNRSERPGTPEARAAPFPASAENVSLIGFMTSGKSAVGRALAQALGWDFADLDEVLEAGAGMPVSEIFRQRGEAAFRESEARALEAVLSRSRTVVATGGGAVLGEANRRLLRARSRVVWLRLSCAGVLSRLGRRGQEKRPLLSGAERDELAAKVARLLAEREPLYRETAHWELIVDGRRPQPVAAEIARLLGAPCAHHTRAQAP